MYMLCLPATGTFLVSPTNKPSGTALKSTCALPTKILVKHKRLRRSAYYSYERHCETAANQVSLQITRGTKPCESLKAQSLAISKSKAWA